MQTQNLMLYRGDTHSFVLEVSDEAGSPLDLTGSKVAVLVAPKGDNPAFSPDVGVLGSQIILSFAPSHTRNSTWRSADYDVQVTQGDVVTTILHGRIDMTKDITP